MSFLGHQGLQRACMVPVTLAGGPGCLFILHLLPGLAKRKTVMLSVSIQGPESSWQRRGTLATQSGWEMISSRH